MPGLITRCQKETLTYWRLRSWNENGEPVFYPPAEMTCRWDDKTQNIMAPDNTARVSRVELITQSRLQPGDYVMRGVIGDIPYWGTPHKNPEAYEVLKSSDTPTLRYNDHFYEAWA